MFAPLLLLYVALFERELSLRELLAAAAHAGAAARHLAVVSRLRRDRRGRRCGWRPPIRPAGRRRWRYLLTQPFVMLHYARSLFLPLRLSADTQWPLVANPLDSARAGWRAFVAASLAAGVDDVAAPRDATDRVRHPVVLRRAAADVEHRAARRSR